MHDLNALFLHVGSYCRRDVITCKPDDRLVECAALMRRNNISSLVVCEEETLFGILTDRDMRNKVVAQGLNPLALTVKEVMNSPIITIDEEEFLFEALHLLSRHRIHRLVVTNRSGRLTGIITDSDLLQIQSRSPQQLVRKIEEARTVKDLKALHQQVQSLVGHLIGTGVRIRDLVRLIAHLNDRIQLRLIHILRSGDFTFLPDNFAFVVLGSEGRGEQTLTTDQDNALVYADELKPPEVMYLKEFSQVLIDALISTGVPPCPGGIMAKNDPWRRSLSQWRSELDIWFTTPTPENILNVSMFSDLRFLDGDHSLVKELKDHVSGRLMMDQVFIGHMIANMLRFIVPLGWFGRIKTEKGEHAGKVDIKKAGIFAITEGIKILSLSEGILENSTWNRLEKLVLAGKFDKDVAEDLMAAFDTLVYFRLHTQVNAIRDNREPDNRITLERLNRMEQEQLRAAFEMVRSFQGLLQRQFHMGQQTL
ncbi:MAG: putative nucleotidyltransferase substrate binding domain-containing protein [Desulfuromonadaceae bacterium]|nr:putative nucleotidyltransferase substrate binding domain-containing protein [Desulfuromonadaceae bacterium]